MAVCMSQLRRRKYDLDLSHLRQATRLTSNHNENCYSNQVVGAPVCPSPRRKQANYSQLASSSEYHSPVCLCRPLQTLSSLLLLLPSLGRAGDAWALVILLPITTLTVTQSSPPAGQGCMWTWLGRTEPGLPGEPGLPCRKAG